MKDILLVEDDALIARIYRGKLEQAGFHVLVAEDGLAAMKLLHESKPHLVVLDLIIPKLSGLDVLNFMRQDPELQAIPVVVFSNAYLTNLWEQIAALGVREMLVKSSVTPLQLIQTVSNILEQPAAPPQTPKQAVPNSTASQSTESAVQPAAPAAPAGPARGADNTSQFRHRMSRDFFEQIPAISKGIQQVCQEFLESVDTPVQLQRLEGLQRKIGFLTHMTSMAGCYRTAQLASALEALLFEMRFKPESMTQSTRHTVSTTITLLIESLARADQPDEQCLSQTRVLVVDDDAVSSRALAVVLARSNLAASVVSDPFKALEKLRQNAYDAVLLDINLPGMSGIALCEEMRKLPQHESTPAIFVTGYSEFEPRARAIFKAGDDLISKPIMPVELTVKVIAHLLRRRLQAQAARA